MKHYVLHDSDGRIRQTLSTLGSSGAPRLDGLFTIEVPAPVDGLSCYVREGRVVAGSLPDTRALRNELMAAIDALELRQARPVREMALAQAAGGVPPQGALAVVRDIEAQIAALRAQLLALA